MLLGLMIAQQLRQLSGYVIRYGPGMVIYWNGFVETLRALEQEYEIYIASEMPSDIMRCPFQPQNDSNTAEPSWVR